MKKSLIFLVFIILSTAISAQSLKFGIGGGITQNTNTTNLLAGSVAGGELTLGTDYHYGIKAKVGLPLMPITFVGHFFSNTMNTDTEIAGVKFEQEGSFSTIGLGAEFGLVPGPISPYLAADVLFTSYGEQKAIVNGTQIGSSEKITRYGLALGAGLDIGFIPKLNLDVMVKYQMNNMFGKEDGEETLNTINATVLVMFNAI